MDDRSKEDRTVSEGLYLAGTLMKAYKGHAFTDKAGATREPVIMEVRWGEQISRVEYRGIEEARHAASGTEIGQQILLRVRAYPKTGAKGPWVSLQGWVERVDDQETIQL